MKARDLFGVIVRTIGLCAFLYAVWNLVFGVIRALFGGGRADSFLIFGVPASIVGILLMFFARPIVRLCYPDNKDDSDA